MTDVSPMRALVGALLLLCLPLAIYCGGCAGMTDMDKARLTISTSARMMVSIDHDMNEEFRDVSRNRAEDPETFRRYNRVVTVVLLSRMALLEAEVALEAIEEGRDGNIGNVIACVVEAVQNVMEVLPEVGVEVPDAMLTVMSMASAFAGTCGADHGIDVSHLPSMSEAISVGGAP
jgi:hypothetical protein